MFRGWERGVSGNGLVFEKTNQRSKNNKEFLSAEVVAVDAQCLYLKVELALQKMKVEKLRAAFAAQTDFVEHFNESITKQEATFGLNLEGLEAKLAEAMKTVNKVLTEMPTHQNLLRDEDHQPFSAR